MRLKGYLVIGPKDGKTATADWAILSCTEAIPGTIYPRCHVVEVILDIPEDIRDMPRVHVKWPTGEVPDDVLAEVKDWTK